MNTTAQVSSPAVDEVKLRHQVVAHVQKIDPGFNLNQATPATTEDSKDDSDLVANVEHALKVSRSKITGEGIWARIGKAIIGANILNKRKAQKAQLKPYQYKSDLDIGE